MSGLGSLFIISAPSGAGKTSLVKALVKVMPRVSISVSYTTRAIRPGERDKEDYYFISHEEFKSMLNDDHFLEYAEVFGNFYGTSRNWVEETRNRGEDIILEIDWQGAKQIRAKFPEAHSIFILPPSHEGLLQRLKKRHPDNPEFIQERIHKSVEEISHWAEYDYIVCNDQFDAALEDIKCIIKGNRLTVQYQSLELKELIQKLLI